AVAGGRQIAQHRGQLCKGAEGKLAGVWDPAIEASVKSAFLATGKPFAADAFAGVKRAFGSYASQWTAMHTEACEATRVRGEQSDELLARRMICLDQRLQDVKALAGLFTRADADVVSKAVQASSSLPGLSACADAPSLM